MAVQKGSLSFSAKLTPDILLNFLGRGWVAFAAVLFTPYFIEFLGIEAYGLLGFFTTMQTVLLLVDFGFSTTLNRAIAGTKENIPADIYTLAKAMERIFFAFSAVIMIVVFLAAPSVAKYWLNTSSFTVAQIENSTQLMGAAIALQLPFMLYSGGLAGLGRQINVNVILICSTTLRFGGGLIVLAWTRKLEFFLMWQIVATSVQTLWARTAFFHILTGQTKHREPVAGALKRHVRFTAGVGITAILGVALTQLDKLALSKLLSLEDYGYYTMAWTLSATLFLLASPIVTAFFPRLVAAITESQSNADKLYHMGNQILSALVAPAACLLILFPTEILTLWVGENHTQAHALTLIAVLSLGTWLNTVAHFPHALQLAHGLSHFGLYANALLVLLTLPLLYLGVTMAGAEGAAWVWVALNAGYVLIGVPLMHRWLLKGQFLYWLCIDLLLPALTSLTTTLFLSEALSLSAGRSLWNLLSLGLNYMTSVAACLMMSVLIRRIFPVGKAQRASC